MNIHDGITVCIVFHLLLVVLTAQSMFWYSGICTVWTRRAAGGRASYTFAPLTPGFACLPLATFALFPHSTFTFTHLPLLPAWVLALQTLENACCGRYSYNTIFAIPLA